MILAVREKFEYFYIRIEQHFCRIYAIGYKILWCYLFGFNINKDIISLWICFSNRGLSFVR